MPSIALPATASTADLLSTNAAAPAAPQLPSVSNLHQLDGRDLDQRGRPPALFVAEGFTANAGPGVRIRFPPAVSPLRTCPHSGRGRISTGMPAPAVLGQGHQSRLLERQRRPRVSKAAQRLFFGSAWLMPVIQAAVVASRSKDPTGCWGPTFLSKLDMDAPVVGFTVLDII
jgi:hypothetical protein